MQISRFFVVFVTTSVTPINYTLVSSGSRLQPSMHTHGRFYYGRSRAGLRPDLAAPGINGLNTSFERHQQRQRQGPHKIQAANASTLGNRQHPPMPSRRTRMGAHLTQCALVPQKSQPRTGSRSVQPFCTSQPRNRLTDTPPRYGIIDRNRPRYCVFEAAYRHTAPLVAGHSRKRQNGSDQWSPESHRETSSK